MLNLVGFGGDDFLVVMTSLTGDSIGGATLDKQKHTKFQYAA